MVVNKNKIKHKYRSIRCNLCGKMIIDTNFEYSEKRNRPPVFVCYKCLNKS